MQLKPTRKKPKPEKEQFEAAQTRWFQDHHNFVEWWKNHRHSGFCFKKDRLGREVYRWNTHPVAAWNTPAYKVEYHDSIGETIPQTQEFSEFARLLWCEDQKRTEQLSAKLGVTFDAEHNQKVYQTIKAEYESFNGLRKVWEEDGTLKKSIGGEWTPESMRAKIDKAYEYEPGQSEEETQLLARRREDGRRPFKPS